MIVSFRVLVTAVRTNEHISDWSSGSKCPPDQIGQSGLGGVGCLCCERTDWES